MPDSLTDDYPEAAPFIQQAVEEHGEEWVLEHYYEQLYPLGRVMAMPDKDELPFYDPDEHDTVTEARRWRCIRRGRNTERISARERNPTSDCRPTFFSAVVVE